MRSASKDGPKVLGVIPARGGSKRIPNKNLRLVAGKPLIAYTAQAAKQAHDLSALVVSTECEQIAKIAHEMGIAVLKRPYELAKDDVTSDSVIRHAIDCMCHNVYDIAICLHPTSPVRRSSHINQAIRMLWDSDAPALASVECRKRTYTHNASIYAVKVPWFLETGKLYCDESIPFLMDRAHSVDVDDEADLALAEYYLGNRR